jgi:hypothetical protein
MLRLWWSPGSSATNLVHLYAIENVEGRSWNGRSATAFCSAAVRKASRNKKKSRAFAQPIVHCPPRELLQVNPLKTRNRAGLIFRMAAQSISRASTEFGAFFRKAKAKKGAKQAIVATAHKIARTFYVMLKNRTP